MAMWRHPRTSWAFLLLLSLVYALVIHRPNRLQSDIGKKMVLADGRVVTLSAVTFGRVHTMQHGELGAQILAKVPVKWLLKWKRVWNLQTGLEKARATFTEPHVVLWFVRVPPPAVSSAPALWRAPSKVIPPAKPRDLKTLPDVGMLRWKITSPDGSQHGGTLASSVLI
jgi:hypothetical protein